MSSQQLNQEEMDCVIDEARYGDLESLKEIFAELDPKLLLSIKDELSLSSTIHMAAANGHATVIQYLLSLLSKEDAKVLVNFQNENGNTALHWASLNGHLEAVEVLCSFDADPFLKNKSDHDAIFEAENNNKEEVETWFLKKFSIEDDYEGEEDADVEIKYQPGQEIAQATKDSIEVAKGLEEQTKDLKI